MTTEQRKSLSATLRLTPDIWFRERGKIQLYPSSALRIVDHHLHASGIIPRKSSSNNLSSTIVEYTTTSTTTDNNGNNGNKTIQHKQPRLYEHDWYCCNQSISCLPMDSRHIWLCLESEWSTFSHLWVDSVGSSTVSIGNLITLDSHVLATCRRVFIRKDPISGKTVPFSQQERFRLQKECSMDATISEILSMDPTPGGHEAYKLPEIENFGTFIPKAIPTTKSCLLKVEIGPQHINAFCNKTADCNFILEIAIQAMMISSSNNKKSISSSTIGSSLSIQYFDGFGGGEARLGHELQCFVHDDDRIFIIRRCFVIDSSSSSSSTDTTTTSSSNASTTQTNNNINNNKSSLPSSSSKATNNNNDSPKKASLSSTSSTSSKATTELEPATTNRIMGKPVLIAIAKSSSTSGRGNNKNQQTTKNNHKNKQ